VVGGHLLRRSLLPVSLATFGLLVGCGGSSNSSHSNAKNVQPVAVNGGPVAGQLYPNGAFTSVTVCVPGSSNCQTVGGILVDTGSSGLRILASAMPGLNLPQMTSNGKSVFDCVSFIDGSFLWGPLAQADVKMAGEVARDAGVHVIQDPTGFSVPGACSNGGADVDNQAALGANGILGVGPEPEDCGPACDPSRGGTPPPVYFACESSGNCQTAFVAVGQQVVQPVVRFAGDNNGVLIQFPPVNGVAGTLSGSLIFGIGTQSNNQLGKATVLTLDLFDNFTTKFNGQTLGSSFIDSGSNGLFFQDSAIPQCPANSIAPGFFCPPALVNLSAQNIGSNSAQNTVNFGVDNAVNLFQSNNGAAAYVNLAGPNFGGTCSPQNQNACSFDWGLPFFYGRNVFTAIDGQPPPTGAPSSPWWAY
jgi:hypothetical protein